MNEAIGIIITEVVIVMNPISIDHDIRVRSKITQVMFDPGRRSMYTTKNPRVNTHTVLTMLHRVYLR